MVLTHSILGHEKFIKSHLCSLDEAVINKNCALPRFRQRKRVGVEYRRDRGGGSEFKSTCCSSRGPGFHLNHPHGLHGDPRCLLTSVGCAHTGHTRGAHGEHTGYTWGTTGHTRDIHGMHAQHSKKWKQMLKKTKIQNKNSKGLSWGTVKAAF